MNVQSEITRLTQDLAFRRMFAEAGAVNARHRLERYHNSEKFLQKLPQGGATTMIIETLKEHGPKMTSGEIAKATERKSTTTLSALTRMQRKGLVKHGGSVLRFGV